MNSPVRHPLNGLEMHVTHRCNLACNHCSHYCDFGYNEKIYPETAFAWIYNWSRRLAPRTFSLLGGEPLLDPRIIDYMNVAADAFPDSNRTLVTNGLLLHNFPETFPETMAATNTRLIISVYDYPDEKRRRRIAENMALVRSWQRRYGIKIKLPEKIGDNRWRVNYRFSGSDMMPFEDGDPTLSMKVRCRNMNCFTIHQGSLWPCPAIAYLPLIADRLKNQEAWKPYLEFRPLGIQCTDDELSRFLNAETYPICGMCATETSYINTTIR